MATVVCFGEIMLRLNPEGYLRLNQAQRLMVSYAGGEANVAVSLANYGDTARFISVVPDNKLGESARNSLRQFGVDTTHLYMGGERLGIYFVEKGASQRPSTVIYDRKHSSIATADPKRFDWEAIFEDASWFHWTGITPALSEHMVEATRNACEVAKRKGLTISCDLNYRRKLWSTEEARKTMETLVPYVDVLISNEEDAYDIFGIEAKGSDAARGQVAGSSYESVARQLHERFGCSVVAITLRGSKSANDNDWAGLLYKEGKVYLSKEYLIHLVDRVGGGDSFGGALIHALINRFTPQESIDFAVAASCLKQTIEYDFNQVSEAEVRRLMGGNASGRVQR
ncbi:MAG: sugar kinase [Sphaerochaetaceae bacterium]|nr:sugar kinase [Sphaerochaetaceae bacterium]